MSLIIFIIIIIIFIIISCSKKQSSSRSKKQSFPRSKKQSFPRSKKQSFPRSKIQPSSRKIVIIILIIIMIIHLLILQHIAFSSTIPRYILNFYIIPIYLNLAFLLIFLILIIGEINLILKIYKSIKLLQDDIFTRRNKYVKVKGRLIGYTIISLPILLSIQFYIHPFFSLILLITILLYLLAAFLYDKTKSGVSTKIISTKGLSHKNGMEKIQHFLSKKCPFCRAEQKGDAKICTKCGWAFNII